MIKFFQISYDTTCMWILKNDINELFLNKTETDSQTIEMKLMVTREERWWWSGDKLGVWD